MIEPIINQPWEDIADDVTGSIAKAVQPLLKKAVDDIYSGLLDTTQNYLCDNLAFNIASRISAAEREASSARILAKDLLSELEQTLEWVDGLEMVEDGLISNSKHGAVALSLAVAIAKAKGMTA